MFRSLGRMIRAVMLACAGSLIACASAGAVVGSTTVGTSVDTNPMGRAQDYRVTATATEPVNRLSVYLDGSNTATAVHRPKSTNGRSPSPRNNRRAPGGSRSTPAAIVRATL